MEFVAEEDDEDKGFEEDLLEGDEEDNQMDKKSTTSLVYQR